MENKAKAGSSNESSLLLKYPINLFSPLSSNENLLMPVGVQEISGCSSDSQNACVSSSVAEPRRSSVCQLEQPLHFGGVSKPSHIQSNSHASENTTDTQSFSSASFTLDQPILGSSTNLVQTTLSSFKSHEYPSSFQASPLSTYANNLNSYHGFTSTTTDPVAYSTDILSQTSSFQTRSTTTNSLPSFDSTNSYQVNERQQYSSSSYFHPVKPYWLFNDTVESKEIWYGFSETDSEKLENAYQQGLESVVPTDGGRCDVYLQARKKKFVYFEAKELEVRRCTWFHQQGSSMRFKPYDENTAKNLDEYYQNWISSGSQDTRFVIPGIIGSFLFEKPEVMLHYSVDASAWTAPNEPKGSPKIVKRGLPDGFQIMPNESNKIDHLLFIVQGIGSFCDLRFRTVSECVDGFRDIANKLICSHFTKEVEHGKVGRVEILPVAWHAKLRTSDIGLDHTMKMITLPSIPKLRLFTNDTLIDILLYSSPLYCQSIIDTVAKELNKLHHIFLSRNPEFCGKIFVAGHSLGSLILFDILSNQSAEGNEIETSIPEEEKSETSKNPVENFSDIEDLLKHLDLEDYIDAFKKEKVDLSTLPYISDEDLKNIGLPIGPRKKLLHRIFPPEKVSSNLNETSEKEAYDNICVAEENEDQHNRMVFPLQKPNSGIPSVIYPRLLFHPAAFFAMGSPISMFLAVRGFDTISGKYSFPTCPAFFHIFHPYDPVAFRIEPMIDHTYLKKPVLIPHHKGRKRMHLEIKENVVKFASEMRQKFMDTLHKTWHSFNEFTKLHPFPSAIMESEVNPMVSQEIPEVTSDEDNSSFDIPIGNLNGGRRIDYVLQEKPLEALNDYVWALTSHATYWDSEDTVLMILREIYAIQGINVSPHIENEAYIPESALEKETMRYFMPYNQMIETTYSNMPNSNFQSSYVSSNFPVSHPSSEMPASDCVPHMPSSESAQNMPSLSGTSTSVPGSQHIAPPPLSGFVKRSAFSK